MMTPDELAQLMFRCDRAIGKLRGERLSRRNADELIGATMSLMNRIRVEQNAIRIRDDQKYRSIEAQCNVLGHVIVAEDGCEYCGAEQSN